MIAASQPVRTSTTPIPHARPRLYGVLAKSSRPRPVTTVSSHADKYRVLTSKGSGEPGQWRTDRVPFAREPMDCLSATSPVQRIVLMFAAQMTKALDLDTPIPTPDGWKSMGDLAVGDTVFAEDGGPTRVVAASETFYNHGCYRITFSDGAEIIADAGHRWYVESDTPLQSGRPWHAGERTGVLTTEQIAKTAHYGKKRRNRYAIPVAGPLDLPAADLPIDPYTLGVWLADGHSASAQFTGHAHDVDEICTRIQAGGHLTQRVGVRGKAVTVQIDPAGVRDGVCLRGHVLADVGTYSASRHGKAVQVCAECQRQHSKKSQYGGKLDPVINPAFYRRLTDQGLIKNKRIPSVYLRGSIAQRTALLQGLMDSDGTIDRRTGRCSISSSYPQLVTGILELIRTLGYKPTVTQYQPENGRLSHTIGFMAYVERPVFSLSRKRQLMRSEKGARLTEVTRRRIVRVEKVHTRPVRCIGVDSPQHLFLAGDAMIPTHNTEIGLNWINYVMDHSPAPMLVVLPTLEVRKRWVRQRLDPMINEAPQLQKLFDARRKRDAGNAEDMKDFPGGMLVIGGANSPASLASMPIRYVLCDEVDRFPWEVGEEGDPLGLIDERTKTFPRRKVLLVSTPTVKGASRIEIEYEKSDMREYHVPCPHCGEYQVLRWRHPDGRYGLIHSKTTGRTFYACVHNGCEIDEHHKTDMLAKGRWIARHPDRKVRGYHISGLYSPLGLGFSWAELWDKWEDAHGDTANLKRFINTTLGESWEERGDSVEDVALIARLEDYPETLPVALTTSFTDVQKDRLETTVMKWGAGEEGWTIAHEIHPGDTALQAVWDDLDDYLREMGVELAGIDSGYNTSMVYAFCEKKRWCIPTKGMPGMHRPLIEDEKKRRQRLRTRRKKGAYFEPVGVDQGKALVYARLKLTQPGPGYIHFPSDPDFDDEYFAQVAAEKLVTKVRGTRPYQEWVQTRARNEALDCLVGNLAMMRLSGRSLDAVPQETQQQAPEAPQPQRRRTARSRYLK